MLSFQRSIYQIQLKNKLDFWSDPQNRTAYFGNLPTNSAVKDFGIFRDENGYIYVRNDFVAFYNLRNGFIAKIKKEWTANDWQCYQALYNRSQELKTFRIDIPKYREEILVNDGSTWEYSELQSPGSDYGNCMTDTIFPGVGFNVSDFDKFVADLIDGKIENLHEVIAQSTSVEALDKTKEFIINYVDNFTILVKESLKIAETYKCGLPYNLGDPSMMYKDNQGYFWSDIDRLPWMYSKLEIISNAYQILHSSLTFFGKMGRIDKDRIDQCINYASTQWTTI